MNQEQRAAIEKAAKKFGCRVPNERNPAATPETKSAQEAFLAALDCAMDPAPVALVGEDGRLTEAAVAIVSRIVGYKSAVALCLVPQGATPEGIAVALGYTHLPHVAAIAIALDRLANGRNPNA